VQQQAALGEQQAHVSKQLLGQPLFLQQVPKLQNRRFVWHRIIHEIDSRKAAHRLRIDQHLLHRRSDRLNHLLQQVIEVAAQRLERRVGIALDRTQRVREGTRASGEK